MMFTKEKGSGSRHGTGICFSTGGRVIFLVLWARGSTDFLARNAAIGDMQTNGGGWIPVTLDKNRSRAPSHCVSGVDAT